MQVALPKVSSPVKKIIFWCCAYTVLVQALTLFVISMGSHISISAAEFERISDTAATTVKVDSIRI